MGIRSHTRAGLVDPYDGPTEFLLGRDPLRPLTIRLGEGGFRPSASDGAVLLRHDGNVELLLALVIRLRLRSIEPRPVPVRAPARSILVGRPQFVLWKRRPVCLARGVIEVHVRLTEELRSLLHDQDLGPDLAVQPAARGQLGLGPCGDVALECSPHYHVLRLDVRLDMTARREDHVAACGDLPLGLAVDANRFGRYQRSLQLSPTTHDGHLRTEGLLDSGFRGLNRITLAFSMSLPGHHGPLTAPGSTPL